MICHYLYILLVQLTSGSTSDSTHLWEVLGSLWFWYPTSKEFSPTFCLISFKVKEQCTIESSPTFCLISFEVKEQCTIMVHYSFASKLIRQKVGEDFFDVGYQNQRLPRTFHKWVKSEVELKVNSTHTYICVYIFQNLIGFKLFDFCSQ